MAAEAPSVVDADGSPPSVVDAVAAHLAQAVSPPGTLPAPRVRNGAGPDGVSAGTVEAKAEAVEAKAGAGDGADGEPGPEAAAAADGAPEAAEPTSDNARLAARAVLDVLRASGWADTAEAQRLRTEADRLRELLDLVVRDHRAREASVAGLESQQLNWLVPLLRAAHGVAFGSLGAKVALRTAIQQVPERVLASAGLRIDYGVENDAPGAYEEH